MSNGSNARLFAVLNTISSIAKDHMNTKLVRQEKELDRIHNANMKAEDRLHALDILDKQQQFTLQQNDALVERETNSAFLKHNLQTLNSLQQQRRQYEEKLTKYGLPSGAFAKVDAQFKTEGGSNLGKLSDENLGNYISALDDQISNIGNTIADFESGMRTVGAINLDGNLEITKDEFNAFIESQVDSTGKPLYTLNEAFMKGANFQISDSEYRKSLFQEEILESEAKRLKHETSDEALARKTSTENLILSGLVSDTAVKLETAPLVVEQMKVANLTDKNEAILLKKQIALIDDTIKYKDDDRMFKRSQEFLNAGVSSITGKYDSRDFTLAGNLRARFQGMSAPEMLELVEEHATPENQAVDRVAGFLDPSDVNAFDAAIDAEVNDILDNAEDLYMDYGLTNEDIDNKSQKYLDIKQRMKTNALKGWSENTNWEMKTEDQYNQALVNEVATQKIVNEKFEEIKPAAINMLKQKFYNTDEDGNMIIDKDMVKQISKNSTMSEREVGALVDVFAYGDSPILLTALVDNNEKYQEIFRLTNMDSIYGVLRNVVEVTGQSRFGKKTRMSVEDIENYNRMKKDNDSRELKLKAEQEALNQQFSLDAMKTATTGAERSIQLMKERNILDSNKNKIGNQIIYGRYGDRMYMEVFKPLIDEGILPKDFTGGTGRDTRGINLRTGMEQGGIDAYGRGGGFSSGRMETAEEMQAISGRVASLIQKWGSAGPVGALAGYGSVFGAEDAIAFEALWKDYYASWLNAHLHRQQDLQ